MVQPTIHIVDRFDVPWSGSAFSALALRELLLPSADVLLWSLSLPHENYQSHPIRQIDAGTGSLPQDGTLVIHGNHFELGDWVRKARARRVIVVCNVHWPLRLFDTVARLEEAGLPTPDIAFRSQILRDQAAMEGIIEPPLIDIKLFRPANAGKERDFMIGRISRNILGKHAEDDISLYRMLVHAGCRVRIMGGQCLEEYLGPDHAGIELIEVGSIPAHLFLQELDCFFYRTGILEEAFGRVLLEAMATGLPVVCHRRGGHAGWILSGENGFVFDTQEEAFDLLTGLRDNPAQRRQIGEAARATIEELLGEKALMQRRHWYLGI